VLWGRWGLGVVVGMAFLWGVVECVVDLWVLVVIRCIADLRTLVVEVEVLVVAHLQGRETTVAGQLIGSLLMVVLGFGRRRACAFWWRFACLQGILHTLRSRVGFLGSFLTPSCHYCAPIRRSKTDTCVCWNYH